MISFGAGAQTLQQRQAAFEAAKAAGYSSIAAQEAASIGQRQQQRQAAASAPGASAPVQLQNALKALGTMAGDPTLMKVKVDGVIGPNTVKAVNYAIKLVGGFPPYFKTPNMNVTNVRQYAGGLATTITQHIQQRGGTVPAPVIQKAVHHAAGGGPSAISIPTPDAEPDRRWIWWTVAGGSVLLILVMAAHVTKKHKGQAVAAA